MIAPTAQQNQFSYLSMRGGEGAQIPKLTKAHKPDAQKIAAAVAPVLRGHSAERISSLEAIAAMSGERPHGWIKPKYGEFEYWLAHNCGWISEEELETDKRAHDAMRKRALNTSHRFKWESEPKYAMPKDTGEFIPEMNMKVVQDRNLTDSARRIVMFIMRHCYQQRRGERSIGMTVSFIMKGLSLSRRTVQRSITLLEKFGYLSCEVAKGKVSRMCYGLLIHLLEPLFPRHHTKKWPKKRGNSDASQMPQNNPKVLNIYTTKWKPSRYLWSVQCLNGVHRSFMRTNPLQRA